MADDHWKRLSSGSSVSFVKRFLRCNSCRMDVNSLISAVHYLESGQDIIQWGQGHSLGVYSWKGNSSFSFVIRYSLLAHEEACEAGPSVCFFLILQAFNGFCKLSVNRRPTYQIQQRNIRVILPLKQNQKLEGEENCVFCFFSSSVVLHIIFLITFSILLSAFCSSAFYLK